MSIAVLCIGDIVGRPGRKIVREVLPGLVERRSAELVVANAENAAGGSGVTRKIVNALLESGVHVLTTGDHVYSNKDAMDCLDHERLLRPLNYVPEAAGHGSTVVETDGGARIAVANLVGRTFMDPAESPFAAVDAFLDETDADAVIVDFHAEATSEKIAMGWWLDGRVAAVVGTHTHVQTADARVLPKGTAYVSDLGMTGPFASVLGRDVNAVLHRFTTAMPARFEVAEDDVRLSGAVVVVDETTGRAESIERFCLGEDGSPIPG